MIMSKTSSGYKDDQGKPRIDLVEPEFIINVAKVLTHGAERYGEGSWKLVENPEKRYYSAAMRHLLAWKSGELIDPNSGLPHVAHVAANMMFLGGK